MSFDKIPTMGLSNQEISLAKAHWQETARDRAELASALTNLSSEEIRWLKNYPDLKQLITSLAVNAGFTDPFSSGRKRRAR